MNNNQYYEFNQNTNLNPKLIEKNNNKKKDTNNNNNIPFIKKIKIAIYCFILFVLLSNKNTYKILDVIIKIFRRDTNDIINENGEPLIFGICISGLIFSILILFIS